MQPKVTQQGGSVGEGLAQDGAPAGLSVRGYGGAMSPSSPGNLSGQHWRRFPWSA